MGAATVKVRMAAVGTERLWMVPDQWPGWPVPADRQCPRAGARNATPFLSAVLVWPQNVANLAYVKYCGCRNSRGERYFKALCGKRPANPSLG